MKLGGDPLWHWGVFFGVLVLAGIPAAVVVDVFDLDWGQYRGGAFAFFTTVFAVPIFLVGLIIWHEIKSRRRD